MELAVRKGACTAFAELDVGFRIKATFTPESESVLRSLADIFASFQYDGFETALRQNQGGEQTAGTASDDERAHERHVGRTGDEPVSHVRREPDMGMIRKTCQNGLFVGDTDIKRIGKHDGRFLAGVVIAAIYGKSRYRIAG